MALVLAREGLVDSNDREEIYCGSDYGIDED